MNFCSSFKGPIYFLNAPAGAGKTTALVKEIFRLIGFEPGSPHPARSVLLVQPNIALMRQTEALLRAKSGLLVKAIHSDQAPSTEPVVARIIDHLKTSLVSMPQVLLISLAAFIALPPQPIFKSWNLIVDEIPQVLSLESKKLENNHSIITDAITLGQTEGRKFQRIIAADIAALDEVIDSASSDEVDRVYWPFAAKVRSPNWLVHVHAGQFRRLINGEEKSLAFYCFLLPSAFDGFANVLVAGANFTHSLFYKCYSALGIEFVDMLGVNQNLKNDLRFDHHNGKNVEFIYAIDRGWSKSLVRKTGGNVLTSLARAVETIFTGRFIWNANKGVSNLFPRPGAKQLPHSPHGSNAYSDYSDVAFLSAHNPPPEMFWLCDELFGITHSEVKTAIHFENVYQAIMRSALRNPNDTGPKRVFVPDKSTAGWLASLFPESTLRKIELEGFEMPSCNLGRPAKFLDEQSRKKSDADRKAVLRFRQILIREVGSLRSKFGGAPTIDDRFNKVQRSFESGNVRETLFKLQENKTDILQSHFLYHKWQNVWSLLPSDTVVGAGFDSLESDLREAAGREISHKEGNWLISPGVLKAGAKSKSMADFEYAWTVWLDFDGGDLTPHDFAKIFPDLRMIACNTYSSTPACQKYRVVIPLSFPVTSKAYGIIAKEVVRRVEKAGYADIRKAGKGERTHGIDPTKLGISNLFYAPCRPFVKEASFFIARKESGLGPLEVEKWIMDAELAPDSCRRSKQRTKLRGHSSKAEAEIADWQANGCQAGHSNEGFFDLAVGLAIAGETTEQIGAILFDQAIYSHSVDEHRRNIPRILQTLRQYGLVG